jgi:hypothetical protein
MQTRPEPQQLASVEHFSNSFAHVDDPTGVLMQTGALPPGLGRQ